MLPDLLVEMRDDRIRCGNARPDVCVAKLIARHEAERVRLTHQIKAMPLSDPDHPRVLASLEQKAAWIASLQEQANAL